MIGETWRMAERFAEVWEGRYKSHSVSIKSLRVYKKNEILQVKKVCLVRIIKAKSLIFSSSGFVKKRSFGLSHPNVLAFLCVATSPFPSSYRPILQLRDIVDGLGYLHSLGIIHGDLKGVCSLSKSPHVAYD
jgi:serine/threonine protein kinase